MLKKDIKHIQNEYNHKVANDGNGIYISLSTDTNDIDDIETVKVRRLTNGECGWMIEDSLDVGGFFHQKRCDLLKDAMDYAEKRHNNKNLTISLKRINPHFQKTVYTSKVHKL